MVALRCFFAIKINLVQCILCGQYILVDRFLRDSGYLVECEILSTFGCQFPSKRGFEKSKNTEVCLNLTLTLSGPAFSVVRQALGEGSEAQMPKIKVNINQLK